MKATKSLRVITPAIFLILILLLALLAEPHGGTFERAPDDTVRRGIHLQGRAGRRVQESAAQDGREEARVLCERHNPSDGAVLLHAADMVVRRKSYLKICR